VVGAVTLAVVYLTPRRPAELTSIEEVPERFAKLILEEPEVKAPPIALPTPPQVAVETPKAAAAEPKVEAKPAPAPARPTPRRSEPPKVAANEGQAGRQRAQQEVAQLEQVATSLDKVLADVTAGLESKSDGGAARGSELPRRRTRSGRGAGQVAGVGPVAAAAGATVGSAGAIAGARIEIESIEGGSGGSGSGGAGSARGGEGRSAQATGGGETRTDASLLAVVRKYAPGIQFCYDNELEKNPSLGGKLIVAITVAASGQVTDATVVKDTLRSAALTACALAQIEAWKFPPIDSGEVTFQAPFVFTPPE
jgi:TonB family protein